MVLRSIWTYVLLRNILEKVSLLKAKVSAASRGTENTHCWELALPRVNDSELPTVSPKNNGLEQANLKVPLKENYF